LLDSLLQEIIFLRKLRMGYKLCLLVFLLSHMCWAQDDTSYHPVIGERAAALPYPQQPVPRGDLPHRGGGGIHQHGHSSNHELAISLMHVAENLKKFSNDVESRLDDMFNVLEELKKEQQQVTNFLMVLAYGGGGSLRGKRSTDEYAAPVHTEYYDPKHTTTESPPPYSPNPPAHDTHTHKATYSTDNTRNYNPMDAWDVSCSSMNVYDDLPGTVSKRRFVGSSGSQQGYSGSAMSSYSSVSTTADPPSYSTARPFQYVNMPSFYQVRQTIVGDEDIEELEYIEYAI